MPTQHLSFALCPSLMLQASGNEQPAALDAFCRDLCAEAKAGKIDPVVGRDMEVARVTRILCRWVGGWWCWNGVMYIA